MLSRALVGLALVTAAKSDELEDSTLAQMRSGCPLMLRSISESGASEMQVAMECRAMFPPDVCHGRFTELGAKPWADDKIKAVCGNMVSRIQKDFGSLPRGLEDDAYKTLQTKLNQITKAKAWIGRNPPLNPKTKKPIKVDVPNFGKLDASFVLKVVLGAHMQDLNKQYFNRCVATEKKTCPPTTTKKPPPAWFMPQLKQIAVQLSKGENPTLQLPAKMAIAQAILKGALSGKKPPAKKPPVSKTKLFTDNGPIPETASRAGSAWFAMAAGGVALLTVGAFAVQRTWRTRPALAVNTGNIETTLE